MNNWGAWIINDKNIKIAYWEKLEVANICLFCLRFGRNNLANIKIIIFGLPAAPSSSWQTLQRWLFLCNLNAELQLLLGLCVYEGAIDIGSQYSISLYDMKWGSFPFNGIRSSFSFSSVDTAQNGFMRLYIINLSNSWQWSSCTWVAYSLAVISLSCSKLAQSSFF